MLCLAQAQYLFFRKARENKMKSVTLAKICAQIGIYFQKAFESNQINPNLRAYDNGNFANVLGYHAKYYHAMAYLQLADGQIAFVEDKAKECGKAVAMLKVTVAKFDDAKPFVNTLGGAYKANFDKTYNETVAKLQQMIQENKTVYYDSEPPLDELPKPDPQNFVKTIPMLDAVNMLPPLDNQLRHLVPPAVRQMGEELKAMLQLQVQEQFSKIQTANE